MLSKRKIFLKSLLVVSAVFACYSLLSPPTLLGQEPGENIETVYGFLSSIPGTGESSRTVTFKTPQYGRNYKIKVYFMKAEVSAFMIDAYYDSLNEDGKEKSGTGFDFWNKIREKVKDAESEAQYEVLDDSGSSIGKVRDIGLIPFFKTVTFQGSSPTFQVRISCTEGAGLFRLVFQYE